MAGRSVRWMFAEINAEAVRPTRPVPAPSSSILGRVSLGGDEVGRKSFACLARSSSGRMVGGWDLVQA